LQAAATGTVDPSTRDSIPCDVRYPVTIKLCPLYTYHRAAFYSTEVHIGTMRAAVLASVLAAVLATGQGQQATIPLWEGSAKTIKVCTSEYTPSESIKRLLS
jgi:hypothetical protein